MALLGMLLGTVGLDPISCLAAVHLWQRDARRRAGTGAHHHGALRDQRGAAQHRAGRDAGGLRYADQGAHAHARGLEALAGPIARGSVLGFLLGILPGIGAIIPTFISYALEKRIARQPERFGRGAIEGVAGARGGEQRRHRRLDDPASHAGPSAERGHGRPPRRLSHPRRAARTAPHQGASRDLLGCHHEAWYVGNVMLLVLNLPLIGLWVQLLRVPYGILFPLIFAVLRDRCVQ